MQQAESELQYFRELLPRSICQTGTPYLANPEGGNVDLRVPYIGYAAESELYKAEGISAYNALQAHVEKRLSHGFNSVFPIRSPARSMSKAP